MVLKPKKNVIFYQLFITIELDYYLYQVQFTYLYQMLV